MSNDSFSALESQLPGQTAASPPVGDPFIVYPHPAGDRLNVLLPTSGEYTFRISSVDDQHLQWENLNGRDFMLDLTFLAKGSYLVEINAVEFHSIQKLLKQ